MKLEDWLARIADRLIQVATTHPDLQEGTVMTVGPLPYRRLDCDGRALAYVRTRPRKRAVRIDVSGLWITPQNCRLRIPSAGGSATLIVTRYEDLEEAVAFLYEAVDVTRRAYEKERTLKKSA